MLLVCPRNGIDQAEATHLVNRIVSGRWHLPSNATARPGLLQRSGRAYFGFMLEAVGGCMNENVLDRTKNLIEIHEGAHLKAYICPAGHWTVGIGCRWPLNEEEQRRTGLPPEPDEISVADMYALLNMRLQRFWGGLRKRQLRVNGLDINDLPDNAQIVAADHAFNLGVDGSCKFIKMWKAIASSDFELAAHEMLWNDEGGTIKTPYHEQVPMRAQRLSDMLARCAL